MTKRAAIYIRQSQTSDDTISPELQEKNVRRFIEQQGWTVVGDPYSDIDISGLTEAKRPDFLKLKKDFAAGKFDIAVADDFSRFSRNKADAMALLGSMNIATAKEGVADADDDFMPAMYFLLADKFSKDMSKRWRHALMHRLSKGLPASGNRQFGYDKQGKEAYVINPVEAAILREAYDRYTKGEGVRTICEDFNKRNLPAPGSNGWYSTGMFDLLDKVFYAGKVSYDGQEFPGAHEPILTKAQWAAYRKARESRKKQDRPRNPKWMLHGLVFCGHCGGKMLSHMARGVPNLLCATYNSKGKKACPGTFRKRAVVQTAVWWWLGSHLDEWASAMPTNDEARIAAEKAVADAEAELESANQVYMDFQKYAFENKLRPELSALQLAQYSEAIDKAQATLDDALAELGSFTPASDVHEQISQGSLLMGFEADPEAEPSEAATAQFREALSKIIAKVIIHPATGNSPRDPNRNALEEIEVVPVGK
ncbi:putative recombinase [Arthrobacter sp. ZXY-2]|nr:putative recombinase [Arthrobacter sp. ZXY-2]